nr:MAG TPA: hypothetical protein [Caudoviricetes sp.]
MILFFLQASLQQPPFSAIIPIFCTICKRKKEKQTKTYIKCIDIKTD